MKIEFPCASALLAYWDHPWSPTAERYAYWALVRARAHGIDILEIKT